jgi:hypothetical protein
MTTSPPDACRVAGTVASAILVLAASGCERPGDRAPAGFTDACHGGETDAKKNWVCSENRLIVTTTASETEWPALGKLVGDFGRSRSLKVFDSSTVDPGYVRTLEVSVCSSEGLYLRLDKRIFDRDRLPKDDLVTIMLRTYRNSYQWKPLAEQLILELESKWPHTFDAEWPVPQGSDRPLPDSVESCDP